MTLREHVAVSLFAAWRFLTSGGEALKFVEATPLGVVRSFMAIVFALPLFAVTFWLQFKGLFDAGLLLTFVFLFAAYAFSWVVYAALVFYTYATLGHHQEFFRFMPLYNWARVYAVVFMLPYFVLARFDVVTGAIAVGVWGFSVSAVLTYKVLIARAALNINIFPAIVFVLLDVAVFLFVEFLAIRALNLFQ